MLCDAMRCRIEDGDDSAENWKDSNGNTLAPDRFGNISMDSMIAADNSGPCMGIELNIWERAKVNLHLNDCYYTFYINYIKYINYNYYLHCVV